MSKAFAQMTLTSTHWGMLARTYAAVPDSCMENDRGYSESVWIFGTKYRISTCLIHVEHFVEQFTKYEIKAKSSRHGPEFACWPRISFDALGTCTVWIMQYANPIYELYR